MAASGSFVGVVFGGLVWLVSQQFGPYEHLAAFVLRNLIFVNLFWGLLNWLPIRPLDGGHLVMSLLEKLAPERAAGLARIVFTLTSAVALGVAIMMSLPIIAVFAGVLLFGELTAGRARALRQPLPDFSYDDAGEIEAEPDADHRG